jgi:hypothetical protein
LPPANLKYFFAPKRAKKEKFPDCSRMKRELGYVGAKLVFARKAEQSEA